MSPFYNPDNNHEEADKTGARSSSASSQACSPETEAGTEAL